MKPSAQNISALIPLEAGNAGETAIDARNLHSFLGVKTAFKDWISRRIAEYQCFVEGKDFGSFLSRSENGRQTREYHLSINMAKELAMVEKNARGREARQYFLDCEAALNSQLLAQAQAAQLMQNSTLAVKLFAPDPETYGKPGKNDKPRVSLRRACFVSTGKKLIEGAMSITLLKGGGMLIQGELPLGLTIDIRRAA